MRYKHKPLEVEAWHYDPWNSAESPPSWVLEAVSLGRLILGYSDVWASVDIATDGITTLYHNYWAVRHSNNTIECLHDNEFRRRYEINDTDE